MPRSACRQDSIRTLDFFLWVGAIAMLLTIYSLAEWGTKAYLDGLASARPLKGPAPPDDVDVWASPGTEGVAWIFKRFYDTPERADFDRETLRRALGLEGDADFWGLWAFHFRGETSVEVDRESMRVRLDLSGEEVEEIPIGPRVREEDPYLAVSLASSLGEFRAGEYRSGPVSLPPKSARKFLVAFGRRIDPDSVEAVSIGPRDGGSIPLSELRVPTRDLDSFLTRPQEEEFPRVR